MKKEEMDRIYQMFKEEILELDTPGCPHSYKSNDGLWICCLCHRIERGMVDPYVEYKDRAITSSPYDKLTHFKEKIDEISGLSLLIPEDVMKVCLGKTPEEIKIELQRHRLKKYYSYVYVILRQKGIVVPTLLQHEKDRLTRLFKEIEIIYSKIKKKSNMIAYHFLLSKMLPMIGRSDIVPFLYKLHSKRKIREYENLWERIMTML